MDEREQRVYNDEMIRQQAREDYRKYGMQKKGEDDGTLAVIVLVIIVIAILISIIISIYKSHPTVFFLLCILAAFTVVRLVVKRISVLKETKRLMAERILKQQQEAEKIRQQQETIKKQEEYLEAERQKRAEFWEAQMQKKQKVKDQLKDWGDSTPITGKKILIMYQIGLRALLTEVFKYRGFELFEATNGSVGIDMNQLHKPDIIILDFRFADFDGIEILKKIQETNPHVNAVFISQYVDSDLITQAKQLGARGFFQVPIFDLDDLYNLVKATQHPEFKNFPFFNTLDEFPGVTN